MPPENVTQKDQYNFTVRSTDSDFNYSVDIKNGICDCLAGQTGSICKHQVACANVHLQQLPQYFESTKENRRWLAGVALGIDKVPELSFFCDLQESPPDELVHNDGNNVLKNASNIEVEAQALHSGSEESTSDNGSSDFTDEASTLRLPLDIANDIKDVMLEMFNRFGDDNTRVGMEAMLKKLKSAKTGSQYNSYLFSLGSSMSRIQGAGRGKIPCQPTSISRRGPGMPRGAAPLGKGRKRKNSLLLKAAKRPRNLAYNIACNQANGKSHG